jgi:phosphotriesterase-related protein
VQVHANAEKDFALHLEALRRGAWVEYDGIGGSIEGDEWHLELVRRVLDAGYGERVLVSQDVVGWRSGTASGGNLDEQGRVRKRYGFLVEEFVPRLRGAGVSEETVRQLTVENPRRLLAISEQS